MMGTLALALDARHIPTYPEKLTAEVEGTVERLENLLLITRIDVKYSLKVPKGKKEAAERALLHHERQCDVSQSVRRGIEIQFAGEILEEELERLD